MASSLFHPYLKGVELRNAFKELLEGLRFTHALTLTHRFPDCRNRGQQDEEALLTLGERALKRFHFNLDKNLLVLGGGVARYSKARRSFFVAVPEKISTSLHYHALVRLPVGKRDLRFLTGAWWEWAVACDLESLSKQRGIDTLCRSTSASVRRLRSDEDKRATVNYYTKELWKKANFDGVVFSDDFLPRKP